MYVLLTTLIVGVYFSFVPGTVRAQIFYGVLLDTDDDTDPITILTDTNDLTFTMTVTNEGEASDTVTFEMDLEDPTGGLVLGLTSPSEGDDSTPTLNKWSVELEAGTDEEITLTIPRRMLSKVGEYNVSVYAWSTGDPDSYSEITFHIMVKDTVTKPYEVAIIGVTYTRCWYVYHCFQSTTNLECENNKNN